MRLEDYWGVGPKTSETLTETLGVERAIDAIESGDIGALTEAGVQRGRAVRILRRANDEAGMDVLGTRDTRSVYDDLLGLAAAYALTDGAADRIRLLTPMTDREQIEARLDDVLAARDAWEGLDDADRDAVTAAFDTYDEAGGTDRAAVETALALRNAGLRGGTFSALDGVDEAALSTAAEALGHLQREGRTAGPTNRLAQFARAEETGDVDQSNASDDPSDTGELRVTTGADDELDRLRDQLSTARDLEANSLDALETIRERSGGARNMEDFRSAFVEYVADESGLGRSAIRSVTVDDAADAADFVSRSLRDLTADLERRVEQRETEVRTDLLEQIEAAGEDVERAIDAVDDIAFLLSVGRFAVAEDLSRPELVDGDGDGDGDGDNDDNDDNGDGNAEPVLGVVDARNPFLAGDVQPITYAVGSHALTGSDTAPTPPTGDRVAVLTGANSGGKTTLLETLAAVALLASMGLPVPAERAEVGQFDTIVFHRRHASFNAGVLESTLKSIVPPLADDGRTLMLVDEFEAITEPGRAADLLNGLVELTVEQGALGVYVTHLADDLAPLPELARIDGIFAQGLTEDLDLRVDYQPRFGTVGKSTPEFIVSRLVANAKTRPERHGFEALAGAVGEEAVQRTLSDVRWEA